MTRNFLLLLSVSGRILAGDVVSELDDYTPWQRHTIDNTSQGADGVRLADFNGDGRMDVVTGWEEGGKIRYYEHPGYQLVREPWPLQEVADVGSPEDAVFVDLNGDGRLEVVSSCEGNVRRIQVHSQEDGLWKTASVTAVEGKAMWMMALPLDCDGQNGIDVMVGSKGEGGGVGWLEVPQDPLDGKSWRYHHLREAGWIMSLESADMDGDGDLDVVVSDRRGEQSGVFWLEHPNVNTAKWPEHSIGGTGEEVMFLDVVDLDGDSRLDVVCAIKPTTIALWSKTGENTTWREQRLDMSHPDTSRVKAVRAGDIDQDGDVDLVFSCEGASEGKRGVVCLLQSTSGTWRMRDVSGPEGVKFDHLKLLDLDADGDLDILTCEERENLGVIWYENPGSRAESNVTQ